MNSTYHRDLMDGYRTARDAQASRAEAVTAEYASELRDFYAAETKITFKSYLREVSRRG